MSFPVGAGGPANWAQPYLDAPPILNGWQLPEGIRTWKLSVPDGSGIVVPLHTGASVYQESPTSPGAPLSCDPEDWSVEFFGSVESVFWRVRRLAAQARYRPIQAVIKSPIEDAWVIPTTAKTTWVLSRSLAYDQLTYASFPARAFVCDNYGSSETELDLVTAAPGAGEVQMSQTTAAASIVTPDMTADAGRLLVLRYFPTRYFKVSSWDAGMSRNNDLPYSLGLSEHVPVRAYE